MVNLPRHMKGCHPGVEYEKQVKQRYDRPQKTCGQCGAVTKRMDLHAQKTHHLKRGTPEFDQLLNSAVLYVRQQQGADDDLERVLKDYR